MMTFTVVREKQFRKSHTVEAGAPCDWSRSHGATHTLLVEAEWMRDGRPVPRTDPKGHYGTRPARLLRSALWVGVDENEVGGIKWERWEIDYHKGVPAKGKEAQP